MYDSNELLGTNCPCFKCIVLAACKHKMFPELMNCILLHDYLYTEGDQSHYLYKEGGQRSLDIIHLGIALDIMEIVITKEGMRFSLKYKGEDDDRNN